jgi:hypothetical protein
MCLLFLRSRSRGRDLRPVGPSGRGSRNRRGRGCSCGCDERSCFAQAVALAVECDDVAVVQEAVEDRGRGRRVGQELGPVLEVDVGGDRDRALFVGGGDEAEQMIGSDSVQGGEAEVVDDDEVVV